MNFLKTSIAVIAFVFCMNVSYGFEFDLTTICKHPTKDLVYIGGLFNTVLIVDAKSGETKNQLDLNHGVDDMEFTQNGKELMIFDGKIVHFIDAETGAESRSFKADDVRFFEQAPYFTDISWMSKTIKVYSTIDGALIGTIKPDFDPMEAGFSPDFKELMVMSRRHEIAKEGALIAEKVEKGEGYSPFNNAYVKQQSDGQGSTFAVYEMPTLNEKMKVVLPYETSNGFDLTLSKFNDSYYLSCWDMLIKVSADGKAYPIQPDEASFTQTSGVSLDGRHLILLSSEEGTLYQCDKAQGQHFNVAAEFMAPSSADLTFTKENVYLLSDDYSVITMNYLGQSTNRSRILTTLGGFGIYYYNGNDAGDDRNTEGTIINNLLTENNQPTVNLDEFESGDNVFIGKFKTIEEAEAFMDALEENDLNYTTNLAPLKKG